MATFEDDFGDDEDFGLGTGEFETSQSKPLDQDKQLQDDLDADLYEDVAGGFSFEEAPAATAAAVGTSAQVKSEPEKPILEPPQPKPQPPPVQPSVESKVPIRKPEPPKGPPPPLQPQGEDRSVGPPGSAVYVGSLQWWTTDAQLEVLCANYGHIRNLKFFEEKSNGKSKGFALVEFAEAEAAARCKDDLYGRAINGKTCIVTFPQSQPTATKGPQPPAGPPGKGAPPPRAQPPGMGMLPGRGMARGRGFQTDAMNGIPAEMFGFMPPPGMPGLPPGMGMPPMPPMGIPPSMAMGMGLPHPPFGMPFPMGDWPME